LATLGVIAAIGAAIWGGVSEIYYWASTRNPQTSEESTNSSIQYDVNGVLTYFNG